MIRLRSTLILQIWAQRNYANIISKKLETIRGEGRSFDIE